MVTIKSIAKEAGVSYSTVSVALGTRKTQLPLAPKTREKVLAAAKKLGYRKNILAEQIRTGKTNSFAFLTINPEIEYIAKILLGVLNKANELGYTIRICKINEKSPVESYDKVLEFRHDGIITIGQLPQAEYLIQAAKQLKIPVGCADCKDDLGYDICIYSDDKAGEIEAINYLYEQGCRKFAFVAEDQTNRHYVRNRLDGFKEALSNHKLAINPEWIVLGVEHISEFINRIKERAEYPEAICCASDFTAGRVIIAALTAGFKIPDDFKVIGFGNLEFSRDIFLNITSVSQNYTQIGSTAVEALLDKINHDSTVKNYHIPTSIIKRCSTQKKEK